jgi:plasmid stabilization system protein ParE
MAHRACTWAPRSNSTKSGSRSPALRSFRVGRYVIIYRVENEDVLILHVIAAARDIEPLL